MTQQIVRDLALMRIQSVVYLCCNTRHIKPSRGTPFREEPNPESTEGGRRVSVLKWPKGAPLNLG